MINLGKARSRPIQKSPASLGQTDARNIPLEKGDAELVLQRPHPPTDRRLPDTKNLGRTSETEMLGNHKRLGDRNKLDRAGKHESGRMARIFGQKILKQCFTYIGASRIDVTKTLMNF